MNLSGIAGLNMGDGAGGKIALSIQTKVLNILSNSNLSYIAATAQNSHDFGNVGTASYYLPEIIGVSDYGDGTGPFQQLSSGLVSLNINSREKVKYTLEQMDLSRLENAESIVGMISAGIAIAIKKKMNAVFLEYLSNQFKTQSDWKTRADELAYLGSETMPKPDDAFSDYYKLEKVMNKIAKTYSKKELGVEKANVFSIFSLDVDTNLKVAFRNQPNAIGNWQINSTLAGQKIGNILYITDDMLDNKIDKNTSFSLDKDYDFSNLLGFTLHNEAVAFPMNNFIVANTQDPDNANPRFITKWQYGIGALRPNLIYAWYRQGQKPRGK